MAVDPTVTFSDAPRPANGGSGGGAAGAPQIRLGDHSYAGGGATLAGADRPNPREISNAVFTQLDAAGDTIDSPNAGGFSSLLWVWGQFLDHDLDQTASRPLAGTAPITIPAGDPVFPAGSTLGFNRSDPIAGTGANADNPRQFANQITAFHDGSNLYGSDATKLAAVREPGSAKLRLTADGTIAFGAGDPVFGNGAITGDTRADENIALLSMHALFAREHNRLVDELEAADPSLTTAELFQGARARVEAIMQSITYNEFLPILVGADAIPEHVGFRPGVNPAIALEFSTAVYRLGHTLLSPTIERMNEDGSTHALGDIALRDAFQRRGVVEQTGIEAILRGMSTTMSQELDTFIVEDVRSLLFGGGGPGTDLASLNIQRGRDHGLPSYNDMRIALGLAPKTSFAQITGDSAIAARLASAYDGDIAKLDLWVGGLAEDAVGGGMLGETFREVMIDQFTRLRDGDPFWSVTRGFGAAELAELRSTTLSDVILRNSAVETLQDDAFLAYARLAGGAGGDTIAGGAGRNLIVGLDGNDRLIGAGGRDHLVGGDGGGRLEGKGGADTLVGGAGNDTLIGGSSADVIDGDDGGDVIVIGGIAGQADVIRGGPGADTLLIEARGGDATLDSTARICGVETFDGNGRAVRGNNATNELDFSIFATVREVASILGLAGNDSITGSAAADTLLGGDGADTLTGRGGDDVLTGGRGADAFVFRGGAGSGADRVTDFDAAGDDVIRLLGFSFGSDDPDGLSAQAQLNAVAAATRFDAAGALIDLDAIGGSGEARLAGVTSLSFSGTEDFLFA